MLGYVIVAVINKKIPLINTSVLRFPDTYPYGFGKRG
jgi:hypothetical protein